MKELVSSVAIADSVVSGRSWSARLLDVVHELEVSYGFERSIRLSERAIHADRFLITMSARDVRSRVPGELDLWSELGAPAGLRRTMSDFLQLSDHVHVGYEAAGDVASYKVYFEKHDGHTDASLHAGRPAHSGERLLHVAYKWPVLTAHGWVESHYVSRPHPSVARLIAMAEACYSHPSESPSRQFARAVLDQISGHEQLPDLRHLQVAENGNERRSFDWNLYDFDLTVADVETPLAQLADAYEIPRVATELMMEAIRNETLGHVAGGTHRNGGEFVTIYHGVIHECR